MSTMPLTPIGPWLVARLLAGMPAPKDLDIATLGDPWASLAAAILTDGADRLAAFDAALAGRPDATKLRRAILAVDVNGPPPSEEPEYILDLASQVPDLPKAAQLPVDLGRAGQEVGEWLTGYVKYTDAISPLTPDIFHEAAGLWLIGVAIARRLRLQLSHAAIYPNLFALWVAPTTLFAKSTGLELCHRLALDTLPHLLMANEQTPEALQGELAGREPTGLQDLPETDRELWTRSRNFAAQRGMILDEASALFSSFRRDYNIGLWEILVRLYDCPPLYRRVTRAQGFVVVRDACLSFLGATTPAALQRADSEHLWSTGLWARFALLTPEKEPAWRVGQAIPRPDSLAIGLRKLATEYLSCPVYPDRPQARDILISSDAFQRWQVYDKSLRFDLLTCADKPDGRLWGVYGRLPTQALKIALCLAAIDWQGDGKPVITVGHWARAQGIAERWRASAHRLLEALSTASSETDQEDRVERLLQRAGSMGITSREIQRTTGLRRDTVQTILEGLKKDGLAKETERKGSRGPAAKAYCWTEENVSAYLTRLTG